MQLISLADIARRAGVQPAAVSNWRRRHRGTFPEPILHEGRELFRQEEIAEWLDDRKINRASLLPGEAAGHSYGDRFRAAAGATTPAPTVEQMTGHWARTLRLAGLQMLSGKPDALLELVTTRLRDEPGWAAFKALAAQDPVNALHTFLRSKGYEPSQIDLVELGDSRFAEELLKTLDRVVHPPADGHGWSVLTEALLEALAEWSGPGSEHYTPRSIVDLMLATTVPQSDDQVCDPCCGTGELLVRAAGIVQTEVRGHALWSRSAHMARLALTLRGKGGHITEDAKPFPAYGAHNYHVVLSNPPFGLRVGERPWESRFGRIPAKHTEFAWLCGACERLAPGGRAAILMPNGTTFRGGAERDLGAAMVEAGVVARIVALPTGLFTHTGIGVTLWVLRASGPQNVLMVDGTSLGHLVDRKRRWLSGADVDLLASPEPQDRSRLVSFAEIQAQDFDLTPGRYLSRERISSTGTLADRLGALERAERAAQAADEWARVQLRRITEGTS